MKTTAFAFDAGTQFPEDAGESLRPQFLRVLTVAWRAPIERNCIQDELSRLQQVIQDTREEVWNAERRLQHRDRLHPKAREELLKKFNFQAEKLQEAQDRFWELNCPDPIERTRLRTAEGLRWLKFRGEREHIRQARKFRGKERRVGDLAAAQAVIAEPSARGVAGRPLSTRLGTVNQVSAVPEPLTSVLGQSGQDPSKKAN